MRIPLSRLLAAAISFMMVASHASAAPSDSSATSATMTDRSAFPAHWWAPVAKEKAASWEVLPESAGPGEVILSKRHELGLLSNFSNTTFTLDGKTYPSLEGFWQTMLYPEGPDDPRMTTAGVTWKYSREQVSQMIGFEAKAAGDLASANMKKLGIDWVTYQGKQMPYYRAGKGDHYDLIVRASWAKVQQNPKVREALLATRNLVLRPDHHQPADAPPSWRYFDIYMDIRKQLLAEGAASAKK